MRQARQVRLNIKTQFSENRDVEIAIRYLMKSEEINLRSGIEMALSCMFTPIGAAVLGESLSAVKARGEVSRIQLETYLTLALSRIKANPDGIKRQTKLKDSCTELIIDTRFSGNKDIAIALRYLKSGEIDLRTGIEIALSCLFAPIGAAVSGESQGAVKARCEVSRMQLETYLTLALSRFGAKVASYSTEIEAEDSFLPVEKTRSDALVAVASSRVEETTESKSSYTFINFDDEEL